MKRVYITVVLTCLVMLAAFVGLFRVLNLSGGRDHLTIGFIYDNDESTPYTYNFSLAKDAVEKKYGKQVDILTRSNVLDTYGGIGTVPGVIVGAVLMGVINMGMSLMGVDANMQKVVKGMVLLAAVIFDVVSKRGKWFAKG